MSHVNSYNQRDEDGIFLYDKYNRRIGGPYATEEEATRASKAVSEALGERPVEDYRKFLQETNPGILGGQSPVPQPRRELTDEEFEAIFNQRAREYREGLIDTTEPKKEEGGSFLDWLIPKAGAAGLMPQEPASLFNVDALQETRDRKLSPVEQLADTEFRVQLNPQGIAKYSDLYRNPSKYTGLAYTNRPTSQRGFYMDTPTATSENLWKDKSANEMFEPGQVFRHGKSYQITGNLGLEGQGPEDVLHHEAAHDAMTKASSLESNRAGFLDFDIWLDLAGLEHGRPMGIDVQEALTRYHDIKYPKSAMAETDAKLWLKAHIKHSRTEADKEGSHPYWTRYWEILVNELPKFYDALTESAKKRHKALGYK